MTHACSYTCVLGCYAQMISSHHHRRVAHNAEPGSAPAEAAAAPQSEAGAAAAAAAQHKLGSEALAAELNR
jgi:hypothetical protein